MYTQKNDFTHLTSSDTTYIDSLYQDYKTNPDKVDESWKLFFKGFEYRLQTGESTGEDILVEFNGYRLIQSYRARGHLLSDTNPIRPRKDRAARLELQDYDLKESDLDKKLFVGEFIGLKDATLRDILTQLKRIYCYKIGIEYMHSNNTEIRRFVRERFEKNAHTIDLPLEKKKRILEKLNEAQVFEQFLQTKFIGQKRFSLEGGETTIPALDALITKGADLGVQEFVFGMPHRGRLNVLANIIGKSYEFIFKEFDPGNNFQHVGGGDVKYHQGYTNTKKTANGKDVYLKIMHNPSHLEAVAPVALGYARAQADVRYGLDTSKVCPVLIHGDAAVAAQGVVYETLQMAELKAYNCGGAVHFVINNQIGFTTDWEDGRSSNYCTSLARTLEAPILHVNGDEPESVVFAMEFAMEFRQKFKTDIFIDMVCYRKHGHNEGDEPKYTQPHLYGLVAKHKNPREVYIDYLLQRGDIKTELAKEMQAHFQKLLSDRFNEVKEKNLNAVKPPYTEWVELRPSKPEDFDKSPTTGVSRKTLDYIIDKITSAPEGFNVLKKAEKVLEERKNYYNEDKLDWALGELLAFGSLLMEKTNVRFSGQDVIRGTFSHRHAKIFDEKTNVSYCGLSHLSNDQGLFEIYNSHLSEYAVLGFEYGYSLATPYGLNIWEAQFGDFANTAQVIIDQFISSSESKWEKMCNLVLLLPHGYEGQGPEHSNARPERYLQLAAEDNMIVANLTTPANLFHALRRQNAWSFRKPLVIFTPKSLLRYPRCVSTRDEFEKGSFQEVIDDSTVVSSKVKRVLVSSGKIYYDLLNEKEETKRDDIALVRLEQIYPFPTVQFKKVLEKYSKAEFYFVQEEPKNMGYWTHLFTRDYEIFKNFKVVSRPYAASPAVGFSATHKKEQTEIIKESFKK